MGRVAGNPQARQRGERGARSALRLHMAETLGKAKTGDGQPNTETVGRDEIARRLGISGKTLDTYTRPTDPVAPSGAALYRLMVEDVLPDHARLALLRAIAFDADCAVVELPDPDAHADTTIAMCELVNEVGDVAAAIKNAIDPLGVGGTDIAKSEAEGTIQQIRELIEKAVELRQVIEREAGV